MTSSNCSLLCYVDVRWPRQMMGSCRPCVRQVCGESHPWVRRWKSQLYHRGSLWKCLGNAAFLLQRCIRYKRSLRLSLATFRRSLILTAYIRNLSFHSLLKAHDRTWCRWGGLTGKWKDVPCGSAQCLVQCLQYKRRCTNHMSVVYATLPLLNEPLPEQLYVCGLGQQKQPYIPTESPIFPQETLS